MTKQTILILEPESYSEEAIRIYSGIGSVKEGLLAQNQDATILVVRLNYMLDQNFLKPFTNLKSIVTPTTGLNHIDHKYCLEKGIRIFSLKDDEHKEFLRSVTATAEHTFGLILSLVRNIVPSHNETMLDSSWQRDKFKGRDLSSMTIGVLGVGRIGEKICHYANAFGMNVLACDEREDIDVDHVEWVNIDQLFALSDIVTVHVNYKEENIDLVSKSLFDRMKPGSFFINTSRGEVVDHNAILECSQMGHLAGMALDVLPDEQNHENIENLIRQFREMPTPIIITPHLGGCTSDSMIKTEVHMANHIVNVLSTCESE